jgi:hypothetical protein
MVGRAFGTTERRALPGLFIRSKSKSKSKARSKSNAAGRVPALHGQRQNQRQEQRCRRPWFPPFAKGRKMGHPLLFFADRQSKSPPCAGKNRRDKDGAPAGLRWGAAYRSAEALRHPKACLRGAEAPLFHGGVGPDTDPSTAKGTDRSVRSTRAGKSNINVNGGAAGVCGSHFSQRTREMGHPLSFWRRRSQPHGLMRGRSLAPPEERLRSG